MRRLLSARDPVFSLIRGTINKSVINFNECTNEGETGHDPICSTAHFLGYIKSTVPGQYTDAAQAICFRSIT